MNELGVCICCNGFVGNNAEVCPHCGQTNPFKELDQKLYSCIVRNDKMGAIKRVRELFNLDLLDAKYYIDKIWDATKLKRLTAQNIEND